MRARNAIYIQPNIEEVADRAVAVALRTHILGYDANPQHRGLTRRQVVTQALNLSSDSDASRSLSYSGEKMKAHLRDIERIGVLPVGYASSMSRFRDLHSGWSIGTFRATVDAQHWPTLRASLSLAEWNGKFTEQMVAAAEALLAYLRCASNPGFSRIDLSGLETDDFETLEAAQHLTLRLCEIVASGASDLPGVTLRALLAALASVFPTIVSEFVTNTAGGWNVLPSLEAVMHGDGLVDSSPIVNTLKDSGHTERLREKRVSHQVKQEFNDCVSSPPTFVPESAVWLRSLRVSLDLDRGGHDNVDGPERHRRQIAQLEHALNPEKPVVVDTEFHPNSHSLIADCDRRAALWILGEFVNDAKWDKLRASFVDHEFLGSVVRTVQVVRDSTSLQVPEDQAHQQLGLMELVAGNAKRPYDPARALDFTRIECDWPSFESQTVEMAGLRGLVPAMRNEEVRKAFKRTFPTRTTYGEKKDLLRAVRTILGSPCEVQSHRSIDLLTVASVPTRASCSSIVGLCLGQNHPQYMMERGLRALAAWRDIERSAALLSAAVAETESGRWSESMLLTVAVALTRLARFDDENRLRAPLAYLGDVARRESDWRVLAAYTIALAAFGDDPAKVLSAFSLDRLSTTAPSVLAWTSALMCSRAGTDEPGWVKGA